MANYLVTVGEENYTEFDSFLVRAGVEKTTDPIPSEGGFVVGLGNVNKDVLQQIEAHEGVLEVNPDSELSLL